MPVNEMKRARLYDEGVNLLPRDEKFFDLFVDQAGILLDAAKALDSGNYDAIADFESKGDEKMRDILDRLNQTFITPIDPEDVSEIATGLETLIDQIETLGFRLRLSGAKRFGVHSQVR
jgi:uncharacterized protein Yka (UPF0111/DUF47 family)